MVTSCFFCQNLLSDYIEGMLPSSRHDELAAHLKECVACAAVQHDLEATLDLLHTVPHRALSSEMALRIGEASRSGRKRFFTRARISQLVMVLAVPALVFAGLVVAFPQLFPVFSAPRFTASVDESQFVKYSPLAQGASEIIDEQASWLQMREPFMRSVWEEGGLSPEEFEKTFELKPSSHVKASKPAVPAPASADNER